MARVDFYVVTGSGDRARQQFACRLAEKAYRLENSVYIEVSDSAAAHIVDEMLWTFRDSSFVPHNILASAANNSEVPVTIGFDASNESTADLVINLTNQVSQALKTASRIAEIVSFDEDSKVNGRQKFTTYRNGGHTLETHRI